MTNFCPLCSYDNFEKSWLSVEFVKIFDYYRCRQCRSLVCHPMPDDEILLKMYSGGYFEAETSNMFKPVTDFLQTLPKGVFLDYGCGSGRFLNSVHELGWDAIGVEFSPETVEKLQAVYPFEVAQVGQLPSKKADVIHLADVLEHLTDLERQMPEILNLVNPGGYVIAHGPLEGNANLFQKVMELSHRLRGRPAEMPPYHVMLATAKGQRALFRRFGLEEIEFKVEQINFPAKDTLREARGMREKAIYLVRKASQIVASKENGNHYYFVGRKV